MLAVAMCQLVRNRDWVAGAGWTTAALLMSLGWLWPWYVIWLLPLAAVASSARLRGVALVLTTFLLVTGAPYTVHYLAAHGINPLSSPLGQRAAATTVRYMR